MQQRGQKRGQRLRISTTDLTGSSHGVRGGHRSAVGDADETSRARPSTNGDGDTLAIGREGSKTLTAAEIIDAPAPGDLDPGLDAARPAKPRVSVVIPALNEARNLPHVFAELPDWIYEIVLVDGNSTDGTAEIARELFPDVRIVGQTGKGKGNALAAGFAACRGDIIVMLDADGSADPGEIASFIDALSNGADFAKGSRFIDGGGSSDITLTRRAGNWFFSTLVNVLYGTNYSDLCYGYNAFWRRCLSSIPVDCDGFEVETLINIRAARAGLAVTEIPSFERDRIHGESNLRTFRDGFRVLKTIFRERSRSFEERERRSVVEPLTPDPVPAPEVAA